MYSTENEIYSLASCITSPKYSGDTITLRATPRDGIGPYYVAFKKDGIIIDPSRLGGDNPITSAPENVEIIRIYTLDDADVRNAVSGNIQFSVFIRGSCPTGGGLQLDGVNDYVDAGNAASLYINNFYTISAWSIRLPFALGYGMIGKSGIDDKMYIVVIPSSSSSSYVEMRFKGSGATYSDIPNNIISYNAYDWNYYTFVKDGSVFRGYVNGVEFGTMNNIGTPDNSAPFQIGKSNNINFKGSIDEVRIYNRALSPAEVLNNYNGYTTRDGLVLEHIYSLGNANDLSGYDNNGTPINGPIFIPNACMDTCTVAIGCVAPVCNFVVT